MPTMPYRRGSGGSTGQQNGGMIAGRYKIIDEAGRGNFARVVRAKDVETGETVAVKILSPEYARDAQFELEVLQAITKKDPSNHFKVCKLRSHFKVDGFTYFVFDLLGPSLKQRRSFCTVRDKYSRRSFTNLTKQLARALQYMHFECRLVHTDLKPENILIDDPNPRTGTPGGGWTVVDLGSASFFGERPDRDLISTRPYRAPEVLVGSPWSYAADMWSFGCILYELYTGKTLFEVSNDAQHLQLIERRVGGAPRWFADTADPKARHQLFDSNGRLRPSVGMGHPMPFGKDPHLKDDPEFVDLLRRLLHYDPAHRLRADEVCNHPFVKEADPIPHETAVLTRLPPSAYSSGQIRTPGCRDLQAGAARARLDKPLPNEKVDYEPDNYGRRSSDPREDTRRLEQQLARVGLGPPSTHPSGMPPPRLPSRAAFAAEDSLRAISAADSALHSRHFVPPPQAVRAPFPQHRGYIPPPTHHRLY